MREGGDTGRLLSSFCSLRFLSFVGFPAAALSVSLSALKSLSGVSEVSDVAFWRSFQAFLTFGFFCGRQAFVLFLCWGFVPKKSWIPSSWLAFFCGWPPVCLSSIRFLGPSGTRQPVGAAGRVVAVFGLRGCRLVGFFALASAPRRPAHLSDRLRGVWSCRKFGASL